MALAVTMGSMGFPSGSEVKNPPAMQEPEETQVRSLGQEDPLEEGMATHCSIPAWRILRTEEFWWVIIHKVAESDTTEATQQKQQYPVKG